MSDDYYANWAKTELWPIYDAMMLLVDYKINFEPYCYIDGNGNDMCGDPMCDRSSYYSKIEDWLRTDVKNNKVYFDSPGSHQEITFDPITGNKSYKDTSYVDAVEFITWAASRNISMPHAFNRLISSSDEQESAPEMVTNYEETDVKYPVYKGLQFDVLEKKQFEELKKHYGMLQQEESKWRRAIPIAAKIGLLFYERGLEKGAKRPEFLRKYKQEFDSLLKNDTVAKYIYDNLPEEYRGGSGTSETVTSIDPVINAAAMAGSMVGSRSARSIEGLKECLRKETYNIPTDEILIKIIEAVQKLDIDDE